jgi:ribosomal protein S28E/S33
MNTFNKKSLYAALAGVSALAATGAAQAVSVNADGLGQALVYPYYTVREAPAGAAYTSLLTVINSTGSAKAVKVRFLEGKNSREVLDFNLYLSKKDVWVAAVIPTATGAAVFTPDLSCTTPVVGATAATATPFVNYAYTGSASDNADSSLDRTREGYVEIIEMGNIITDPDPASVWTSVTHVNGVPACTGLTDAATSAATVTGNGGLFGGMNLINVNDGNDVSYDAVALDNFSSIPLWNAPGSVLPNLANVNPKTSVVTTGTQTFITDWSAIPPNNPVDPVSAVLMHNNVYNEFVVETATASGTDWVLTAPTKGFYVPVGPGNNPGRLFMRNFNGNSGSCDDISLTQFDREERTIQSSTSFSPPPPTTTDSICWEANVISVQGKNVLGSKNNLNLTTSFDHGWLALSFTPNATATAKHMLVGGASTVCTVNVATPTSSACGAGPTNTTFVGLPLIGFATETFVNGAVGTPPIQSDYSGQFVHKYTRDIH